MRAPQPHSRSECPTALQPPEPGRRGPAQTPALRHHPTHDLVRQLHPHVQILDRHVRSPPPPPPSFRDSSRHSCAGRNPCEHPSPIALSADGAPTPRAGTPRASATVPPLRHHPTHDLVRQLHPHVQILDRHVLVVPVKARRLPPSLPVIPAQAGIQASTPPPFASLSVIPPPPFRHSCAGRNPCEHPSPIRAPNARRRSNPLSRDAAGLHRRASPYVTIRRTISYVSSTPMFRFSIDMCSSFPWKPAASAGVSSTGMNP